MPPKQKSTPLMQTKLYRPPVTGDLVIRPALNDRLRKGKDLPLTLVIAPAGYGKSTLISHWIESEKMRAAWIALEESDSNVRTFLRYVVAAVQTLEPDACTQTASLLRKVALPPPQELAATLNTDLNDLSEAVSLVLDDYHAITDPAIHDLLSFQLKHPLKNFHFLILSRRNPALPSASLRARHTLCEVRLDDLAFSRAETEQFLRIASPCEFDTQTINTLN
jgi:LuxR family maltose regulon positive regulatory protein